MPRPIEALIHVDALAHNIARAREAAPDARVWAVVKANAYGHGIERAFDGLRGADGFALLDFDEAQRIRTLGWRGPILMLEGCFEQRDLELCSRLGLWHAVHCEQQIDWLAEHKTHTPHRVFLKLNSGMNRLGFTPTAFRGARARLELLPQVDEISLMTHFSDADDDPRRRPPAGRLRGDHRRHGRRTHALQQRRHAAPRRRPASPRSPRIGGDWVRAGIMSYGSAPDFPERSDRRLEAAPRDDAAQQADQRAAPARPATPSATAARSPPTRPMRIGVVACGYADGYPRHAPTGTPVLVDGVRTRVVGRVSMDMITVDLGPVPGMPASARRSRCGATARRARCCRSTRSRGRPARSATS